LFIFRQIGTKKKAFNINIKITWKKKESTIP